MCSKTPHFCTGCSTLHTCAPQWLENASHQSCKFYAWQRWHLIFQDLPQSPFRNVTGGEKYPSQTSYDYERFIICNSGYPHYRVAFGGLCFQCGRNYTPAFGDRCHCRFVTAYQRTKRLAVIINIFYWAGPTLLLWGHFSFPITDSLETRKRA